MKKTINHQFFFPHAVELVWEYLTKPELMEQWLMKNNFKPIIGFDFQFRTNPISSLDFDGIFYCRVLAVIPFKKLSYSWSSGPGEGEITLDSVVVWKLEATEKGTLLFLEHSGFDKKENLNFYQGLADGWLEKLDKIANLLNASQHGHTST
ncbi:MAG: SRPBCC domain-containing protein [Bacteroidota bacterium]